jgi:hypothetical protein
MIGCLYGRFNCFLKRSFPVGWKSRFRRVRICFGNLFNEYWIGSVKDTDLRYCILSFDRHGGVVMCNIIVVASSVGRFHQPTFIVMVVRSMVVVIAGRGVAGGWRWFSTCPPKSQKIVKIPKNRKSFSTRSKIFRRVVCDCYMSKNFATCRKISLHVKKNRNLNFILSQKACNM